MNNDVESTPVADNLVAVASGAVLLDLQALDLDELRRLQAGLAAEVRRRHAEHRAGQAAAPGQPTG